MAKEHGPSLSRQREPKRKTPLDESGAYILFPRAFDIYSAQSGPSYTYEELVFSHLCFREKDNFLKIGPHAMDELFEKQNGIGKIGKPDGLAFETNPTSWLLRQVYEVKSGVDLKLHDKLNKFNRLLDMLRQSPHIINEGIEAVYDKCPEVKRTFWYQPDNVINIPPNNQDITVRFFTPYKKKCRAADADSRTGFVVVVEYVPVATKTS